MTSPRPSDEAIFHAARSIPDPELRRKYIVEACDRNPSVIAHVAALLEAADTPDSLLDRPVVSEFPALIDPSTIEGPGSIIGPYKLLEQIGEGGFGVVFMAEQTTPVRRRVALKVIKPGMDTRQVVARFEAERQALALMDHPNIAKVFDGGATETGRPYFVMELVRGVPVTEFCDHNQLSVRERLGLFVPVCWAVQHAHQKGVIHRDIKPTNVLVTLHDGVPVPKVIDFGVAKATGPQLTERTLFTSFAQMVGTPLYMSPEQAEMSGLDVDTRADVYALGVLLYELLTGTTPFDKERFKTAGYDEIRRIIRDEEPARPSTRVSTLGQGAATISATRKTDPHGLRRLVRGELDWIVMKCLEKDRNRRYETAGALATDIQRYLGDEAVQACPPSTWYRFGKFTRRNRREALAAGVAAVAGMTGVAGLGVSRALIADALEDATEAKGKLARALEEARLEAYFHRTGLAHRDLTTDNLGRALKLLDECPEDLRNWEWHYLMRHCRVEPLFIRDNTEVNGVAFDSDGERIASAGGDGAIKIWNSRTGKIVQLIAGAHPKPVVGLTFHPGDRYLASVGADRRVKVWDLTTAKELFDEPCDAIRKFGTAYTVAFSADGRKLAAGTGGAVLIWDWKSRQRLHRLPGHDFHSIPVAFSRDGLVATGTVREGLKLWDSESGHLLRLIPGHHHPVSALAFNPDGTRLASASFDRTVKLWNPKTGEHHHTFDLHTGNVECVAFSPDGSRLASAGEDRTVRIWDVTSGREVLGLRGHAGRCGCVAFSRDNRLASASTDRTIRFWDASPLRGDEGQEIPAFKQHSDEIRGVAFSPDGSQRIASAGTDGLVKVWDAMTHRVSVSFSGHAMIVFCVAWHPRGRRLASAGFDGSLHTVKVWDSRTGQELFTIQAHQQQFAAPYSALAFSPDGRHLVTGKVSGVLEVWDAETSQRVQQLGSHEGEVRGAAFSGGGEYLATASSDGETRLWDAANLDKKQSARVLTRRARVPGPSLNVAFSPDGRRLATGGEDNTVKIWDVERGVELRTLEGHTGEVYALAFSPGDGRWLASGAGDSTIKVWNGHSGMLVRTLRGHTGIITSLAFSPDGLVLISGSRDKSVKVWDLSPWKLETDR